MNNEDAISRTRLIENLEYYQKEAEWGDEWNRCIDAIIEEIEAAPSVPPQVAHGQWIDCGVVNSTGRIFKCSRCKHIHNPNKKDLELRRVELNPTYCDGCGAKMDGGEDDSAR